MTSRSIVLIAFAAYAAAVFTAVVAKHHVEFVRWADDWARRIDDRRESLRAEWLAAEGVTDGS